MSEEYKPITNLWKDSEGYRYFGTLKLSSKIKYDGDDFIPLWEWVKQLQQENQQLKEKLDCDLQWAFKYEKQVDNWNKLKEWASNFYNSEEVGWAGCGMRYTLEKILELENELQTTANDCKQCKGSDSNE